MPLAIRRPATTSRPSLLSTDAATWSFPADLTSTLAVAPAPASLPLGATATAPKTEPSNVINLVDSDSDDDDDDPLALRAPKRGKTSRRQTSAALARTMTTAEHFLPDAKTWDYLPLCPSIIKTDKGVFVELRCSECDGNTSSQLGTLLKGAAGFLNHMRKSHSFPGVGWVGAVAQCTIREVPIEEVTKILNSKPKDAPFVDMIPVESETNVAAKKKKERDQEAEDWSFVKNKAKYLNHISCITRHPDGHWVEIACFACGGNFVFKSGCYLKGGIKGFWDHMAHAHDPMHARMPGGPRKIIEVCKVRDLTDQEVEKIRKSQMTITPVSCYSTVSHGYKAESLKKRTREVLEADKDKEDGEGVDPRKLIAASGDTAEAYVARVKQAKEEKERKDAEAASNEIDLTQDDD